MGAASFSMRFTLRATLAVVLHCTAEVRGSQTPEFDLAGVAEIHEMKMEGSIMRMRELERGLEIPAGATVTLEPGSFHLMFIGLKMAWLNHGIEGGVPILWSLGIIAALVGGSIVASLVVDRRQRA